MHTHKYIGNGAFYPGLPAQDLNIAHLSDEQKVLLQTGVEKGLYEVAARPPKKTKSEPGESPAKILSEDNGIN